MSPRQSLSVWAITPGKRWWQLGRLAVAIWDELGKIRQRGRGH